MGARLCTHCGRRDGEFQANLNLVSMKQYDSVLGSVSGEVPVRDRVLAAMLALGSQDERHWQQCGGKLRMCGCVLYMPCGVGEWVVCEESDLGASHSTLPIGHASRCPLQRYHQQDRR